MKLKRTPNSSQNNHSATAVKNITNRLTVTTPTSMRWCQRRRHSQAGHSNRYRVMGMAA